MSKLKKIGLVAILMILGLFFVGNSEVLADSNDFSIAPVLLENQREGVESYFDMTVKPNEQQTLTVTIKNNSSSTQKYNLVINTATTNQNGIVDYSIVDFDEDESMAISLKDIISLDQPQVEVEANSQKDVSFELKVPAESFEGVLLGGITVYPVSEEESDGISNIITRTLAIQLSESDDEIQPVLKAGGVTISQENYRNNVKIELRNVTPTLINKVSAEISITKSGTIEPVLEKTKARMSIAPNSKFNLLTEWSDQFKEGSYTYNILLTDEQGHEWAFSEEFVIDAEEALELNETSYDSEKKPSHNYLLIGLCLIIAVFFLTLLIIRWKKQ